MEEQNRAGDLDTYSQHVSPTVKEVSAIFDLSDDTTTMLGEDAFLTSMESGGAMLNLGHWNTTEHGMEWSDPWGLSGGQKPALANTVVKEGLFDPCGLSVIQKPVMKGAARASPAAVRSPLTPSQVSLSRHMRSGFLGIVKADPDGGWVAGSDAAVAARIAGINSPPLGTSVAPTEDSSTESVLWRAEEGTGLCGGIVKKEPLSGMLGGSALRVFSGLKLRLSQILAHLEYVVSVTNSTSSQPTFINLPFKPRTLNRVERIKWAATYYRPTITWTYCNLDASIVTARDGRSRSIVHTICDCGLRRTQQSVWMLHCRTPLKFSSETISGLDVVLYSMHVNV